MLETILRLQDRLVLKAQLLVLVRTDHVDATCARNACRVLVCRGDLHDEVAVSLAIELSKWNFRNLRTVDLSIPLQDGQSSVLIITECPQVESSLLNCCLADAQQAAIAEPPR